MLRLEVGRDEFELAADALWAAGANGVEERWNGDTVVLLSDADPDAVDRRWPVDVVAEPEGWQTAWRAYATPVTVGRITVRPAWLNGRPDDLLIDPGQAFGSGSHPTTQLCLAALDELVTSGCSVLDVGCGSGVLGIAAALLGAGRVCATDIDPVALSAAADNAVGNAVTIHVSEAMPPGVHDVVVANILAPVLIELAPALMASAAGAALVLSGLLTGRTEHVASAFAALGPPAETTLDGWSALVWHRSRVG